MRPILMPHCPEVNPMISISKEQEYRAIILKQKSTVYFGLLDLIDPGFTIREILIPWLQAGNKPDRYAGKHDKTDTAIFENDILHYKGFFYETLHTIINRGKTIKVEVDDIFPVKFDDDKGFQMYHQGIGYYKIHSIDVEIVGDIHRNPKLLENTT